MTRLLTLFCALLVPAPLWAGEFVWQRLSDDETAPLYDTVVLGGPRESHIALLSSLAIGCTLTVLGRRQQVAYTLTDDRFCTSQDAEDAYAVLNATAFEPFLRENSDAVASALSQYAIDPDIRAPVVVPPGSPCAKVAALTFCTGNRLFTAP